MKSLACRALLGIAVGFPLMLAPGATSFAGMPYVFEAPRVDIARPRVVPRAQPGQARPQAAATVTISHIELTQGIQDVAHSVPLLAGRGLTVRVFMNVNGDAPNAESLVVSGKLAVTWQDGRINPVLLE